MIDLSDKDLQIVSQIFKQALPGITVWVYGSRVTGNAKKYADLDLVIMSKPMLGWQRLEALKDTLSESDISVTVDIVEWLNLSDVFKKIIKEKYHVLQ